jgi:hypothetical protein
MWTQGMNEKAQRADDVVATCPANQQGHGGSIPASALYFRIGQVEEARKLVLLHHYSRRWPNASFVGTFHRSGGLFGTSGDAVAACVFGTPPTRWSEPVVELNRLVRVPNERIPLTKLVSMCVKKLRKDGVHLLVSFADASEGHHGGIYQACNWNYAGQRSPRMDGIIIDGVFVPGRTCNANWGTQSPKQLRQRLPNSTIEPHYDVGKHLYWLALNDSGRERAERLALCALDYPKPSRTK